MCGISGLVNLNGVKENDCEVIKEMNSIVTTRGPDANGTRVGDFFVLGHTRLAIIDLSSEAEQPMSLDEELFISFNGEIYNYIELRTELIDCGCSFDTKSDTEVILKGFKQWGKLIFEKLNGIFSIAIYNQRDKTVLLCRDRLGVKPLYYYDSGDKFYFFSEIKQAIESGIYLPVVNNSAINEYLAYQFTLSNETLFKDIYKVPPGSLISFGKDGLHESTFWSFPENLRNKPNTAEQFNLVKKTVENAVDLNLRSDVPVASYLSSGIDSSIIASCASKNLDKLTTYTFKSTNSREDESGVAAITAKSIGSCHVNVDINEESILDTWRKTIYLMDEPEVGYSLLPQFKMSEAVAKNFKVVLSGVGGDELFFGYGWHTKIAARLIKGVSDIPIKKRLSILSNYLINSSLKQKIMYLISAFDLRYDIQNVYYRFWTSNGAYKIMLSKPKKQNFLKKLSFDGTMDSIRRFELKYWLRGLLHVEDRVSMASGLESRVPFLDNNVLNIALSTPSEMCIDGILNKLPLRKSFNNDLPPEVNETKFKKGYSTPLNEWLEDKELKKYVSNVLNNNNSFIYNYVRFDKRHKFNLRQIWLLISLEIWHETFFKE